MPKTFATLEVRRMRGKLVLIGVGRTDRGQRFIKGQEEIDSTRIGSESFKGQLASAATKLVAGAG